MYIVSRTMVSKITIYFVIIEGTSDDSNQPDEVTPSRMLQGRVTSIRDDDKCVLKQRILLQFW